VLTGQQLIKAIAQLPVLPLQGTVFRFIHLKYQNTPLSAIGSFQRGGRYNIPKDFSVLYTSDTPITALREVRILTETATGLIAHKAEPQIMLSIEYNLKAIVDLKNPNNQNLLGTNIQELTGVWLPMNLQGQIAPTQELGTAIRASQQIEALKVPSAHQADAYNLAIFPDRLAPGSLLQVYDESGTMSAQLP
jgi:RES domain-containing protein